MKKKIQKKTLLLLTRPKFGGKICMSEYKLPGDLLPNASIANQNGFFQGLQIIQSLFADWLWGNMYVAYV